MNVKGVFTVIVGLGDGGEPGGESDGGEVRPPGVWGAHVPDHTD